MKDKPRRKLPPLRLPSIPRISWRDLVVSVGPIVLLSVLAIMVTLHYVRPAPPSTITISSGPDGSKFRRTAEKYQKILARNDITLKILPSAGSLENLKRLSDPNSGVDIALVQGGVAGENDIDDVVSLGSISYEPIDIFYRSPSPVERLSEFKNKRIAIGPEGSGTRALALGLLKANGITPPAKPGDKTPDKTADKAPDRTQLLALSGTPALEALLARQVDAIFLMGDSAALGSIRTLLHTPGIRLFDFKQGDGYVRRFGYLSKLTVPAGAFDLGNNLPEKPLTLMAPTVELLARSSLHPALSDLLIEAAREVHGRSSLFQNAGEFPTPLEHEYSISDDATRFYKSGKRISYRYLPFWLASLVDRAAVVLLPLAIVLIPGLRLAPALYGWRVKTRIYRRYGELMALERMTLEENLSPDQEAALLARLDEIEKSVISVKMPGAFAEQLYVLREHMKLVRERLSDSRVGGSARVKE